MVSPSVLLLANSLFFTQASAQSIAKVAGLPPHPSGWLVATLFLPHSLVNSLSLPPKKKKGIPLFPMTLSLLSLTPSGHDYGHFLPPPPKVTPTLLTLTQPTKLIFPSFGTSFLPYLATSYGRNNVLPFSLFNLIVKHIQVSSLHFHLKAA